MQTTPLQTTVALTANEAEAERMLKICNACRYCEGYCAVFPAMTRRLTFSKTDIHYLANLCHNCGACLHACQYSPPHEFKVNIPQTMAKLRQQTYQEFAWPQSLSRLYQNNGLVVALALALGLSLFLGLLVFSQGHLVHAPLSGNFYAIFPHNLLVVLFGSVFIYGVIALGIGVRRFWQTVAEPIPHPAAMTEATQHVLTLKYLDGGHGQGCNNQDDAYTLARRWFHHSTFYGFLLCFAATSVATLYHYLFGWEAPYAWLSLPVMLGTLGGIGLIIGPVGLLYLNIKRHPLQGDSAQQGMDRGFIALLLLTSITGLALLVGRNTSLMALLLVIHLGAVMALFLTLPYGKFAHGIYRSAALLKWSIERRKPNPLQITD